MPPFDVVLMFKILVLKEMYNVKSGLIVDGSFVEVPRQRNTKEENEQIKKGVEEARFLPMICEKGFRNKPLSAEQRTMNAVKSGGRRRVEHVLVR